MTRIVLAVLAAAVAGFGLGRLSWHPPPPPTPSFPECHGEQHSVEEWVCEREAEWNKALLDCNEAHMAADELTQILGQVEADLEHCSMRCAGEPNSADFEQFRIETQKTVRALAAKRAVERAGAP